MNSVTPMQDQKTTSDGLDFTREYDGFFEHALGTTSALREIADGLREKASELCEMYG
jgi:hypothetical protein